MNNYMKNRIFNIIMESNLIEDEMKKKYHEYDGYEDWVVNQVNRISIEIVKVVEKENCLYSKWENGHNEYYRNAQEENDCDYFKQR